MGLDCGPEQGITRLIKKNVLDYEGIVFLKEDTSDQKMVDSTSAVHEGFTSVDTRQKQSFVSSYLRHVMVQVMPGGVDSDLDKTWFQLGLNSFQNVQLLQNLQQAF